MTLAFKQGYYLAVANIIRTHGADRIAEDVLREFGKVDLRGIDSYDIGVLKPLVDEISRRNKSRRKRRTALQQLAQRGEGK